MNHTFRTILLFVIAALTMWSCSTTPPKSESEVQPEITLRIASLDLTRIHKRIDKKDILALARIVKKEGIEVLAVQNIARYPGVKSRVDFVNEFSARSEMSNVFGEMINNSGRQTGNAIFSAYPITNNRNQSFEKIKSADFEAAIGAIIDAGIQSLTIVCTQFPNKASKDDQERCLQLILDMNPDIDKQPMIIAGNLPSVLMESSIEQAKIPQMNAIAGALWVRSTRTTRILGSNAVETELGSITVARFGLFRQ